jgi:hypothetical protein
MKRGLLTVLVAVILASSLIVSASAYGLQNDYRWRATGTIVTQTVQGQHGRYRVAIDPHPAVLTNGVPVPDILGRWNWTFLNGWPTGGDAPGDVHVTQYDAYVADPASPTGQFTVDYISGAGGPGLPNGWVLQWIQIVTTTNAPGFPDPRNPNPFVDPTWGWPDASSPMFEDGLPFYWTAAQAVANTHPGPGGGADIRFTFTDRPRMFLSRATAATPVVTFHADLYLCAWNQNAIVYIPTHRVEWGFTITWLVGGAGAGGPYTYGGAAGQAKYCDDLYYNGTADSGYLVNETEPQINVTVGGISFAVGSAHIDDFASLAPYIALISTIFVATVATAVYVKRAKRRKGSKEQD